MPSAVDATLTVLKDRLLAWPVPFPSCRVLAVNGETMSFLPHVR